MLSWKSFGNAAFIDPGQFAPFIIMKQNSMTTEETPLFTVPAEAWQIAVALEIDDIEVTSMADFGNLTTDETITVSTTTFTSNGDFEDLPFTTDDPFDLQTQPNSINPVDYSSPFCSSKYCNLTEWASHDEPSGTGDHERFRSVKIKTNYCFQSPTIISQV